MSTPGNFTNGNTDSLTATWRGSISVERRARRASCPAITFAAIFASGTPVALRHERHRARGARVDLEDVDLAVRAPRTARSSGRPRRARARAARAWRLISSTMSARQRVRRQRARRVAGVDAGLLDVLHHAADHDRAGRVGDARRRRPRSRRRGTGRSRSGKPTAATRRRAAAATPHDAREVVLEAARVVDALHRAAAEHVARPHHHRVADLAPRPRRASSRLRAMPQRGARRPSFVISSPNRSRSSARSIASALVPRIGTPALRERHRQLERRLAAELHDHAPRLLDVADRRARPRA